MVLSQCSDGCSSSGVAGDDQHAAALRNQVFANSDNPATDKIVGLAAVGHMGCVGKVEQVSVGQGASNRREDREATKAAVKDANHWKRPVMRARISSCSGHNHFNAVAGVGQSGFDAGTHRGGAFGNPGIPDLVHRGVFAHVAEVDRDQKQS